MNYEQILKLDRDELEKQVKFALLNTLQNDRLFSDSLIMDCTDDICDILMEDENNLPFFAIISKENDENLMKNKEKECLLLINKIFSCIRDRFNSVIEEIAEDEEMMEILFSNGKK